LWSKWRFRKRGLGRRTESRAGRQRDGSFVVSPRTAGEGADSNARRTFFFYLWFRLEAGSFRAGCLGSGNRERVSALVTWPRTDRDEPPLNSGDGSHGANEFGADEETGLIAACGTGGRAGGWHSA